MSFMSSSLATSPQCNDSYGLPLDLWREVLSYLGVDDLCHSAQVCRSWRYLVASLDYSSWRRFFLQSKEWKHPNWPRSSDGIVKKSWQVLYREHVLATKLWAYPSKQINQSKCFAPLFSKLERKIIEVGKHCTHKTLRSALDVATQYDRILIHPGIYDEQFEISSKIPFELIGHGPPGSVRLVVSVEQNAVTGRLCNLIMKAPWFIAHVIKVVSGHLQIDNCILEESQVVVEHPATCHFRYCSLYRIHMMLNHVNISVIENCDFKHCTVCVQGFPKETRGWSFEYLYSLLQTWNTRQKDVHYGPVSGELESVLNTTQSFNTSSAFEVNKSEVDSIGVASIDCLSDNSEQSRRKSDEEYSSKFSNDSLHDSFNSFSSLSSQHSQRNHDENHDLDNQHDSGVHENSGNPGSQENGTEHKQAPPTGVENKSSMVQKNNKPSTSKLNSQEEGGAGLQTDRMSRVISISSKSKLTAQNLPTMEELEKSSEESVGSDSSSTNPSLLDNGGSKGRISALWSSDSESVVEAKLETSFMETLRKDQQLLEMIQQTQGAVFRRCCFHNGVGGVKISQQGQCRIERNHFRELHYAVRCLQNAKVAILQNEICHCQSSGIFMSLAAHGLIADNDVYYTSEAAIDVRRQADPVIQCNRIHHSKRSGIVVLGSAAGLIRGNDIYQNREAAVSVLYRGNPYIVGNRICHGLAAGITVQANGRGQVIDNYIANNRWAGVDIGKGGDPRVCRNLICNGQANGVVISYKAKGWLEANTIKGNDGCGIYVMGGTPLIQTNQIYNNNDTGVSFVQQKDGADFYNHDETSISSDVSEFDSFSLDGESSTQNCAYKMDTTQLNFNTIFHNNGYGVFCGGGDPLTLHGNAIHSNRNVGVYVKQEATVTVASNSVTSNTGVGIQACSQSDVEIEGNGVYENTEHGLLIQGTASIAHNDVFCNQFSAVVVEESAHVKIRQNRLQSLEESTVQIGNRCYGSFYDNHLYVGSASPVATSNQHDISIKKNNFISSTQHGKDEHVEDWHLQNPPPRPHIDAPTPVIPPPPHQHATTMTRVIMPADSNAQQTSKLCNIL